MGLLKKDRYSLEDAMLNHEYENVPKSDKTCQVGD